MNPNTIDILLADLRARREHTFKDAERVRNWHVAAGQGVKDNPPTDEQRRIKQLDDRIDTAMTHLVAAKFYDDEPSTANGHFHKAVEIMNYHFPGAVDKYMAAMT